MRILLLLLTNCATTHYQAAPNGPMRQCSDHLIIGISNNVPVSEQHYISEAVEFWNGKMGRAFFFNIGEVPFSPDDPEAKGLAVVGYSSNYKAFASIAAETHLKTTLGGCIVYSWVGLITSLSSLPKSQASLVVRHELGHLLGLDDTIVRSTIMHGNISTNTNAWDLTESETRALKLFY